MTDPVATTEEKKTARGPRSFKGKSFTLVLNNTTGFYEAAFEGTRYPIRFVNPEPTLGLIDPLAGGMTYRSGRHEFRFYFDKDQLTYITNIGIPLGDDGERVTVPSVTVSFDAPLTQWIRVIRELAPEAAFRIK